MVSRAPVTSSTSSQRNSRALIMYRNTVKAPSSMALAPTQVRWSQIREISLMITRMYLHRSVMSMPRSFSTAEQ